MGPAQVSNQTSNHMFIEEGCIQPHVHKFHFCVFTQSLTTIKQLQDLKESAEWSALSDEQKKEVSAEFLTRKSFW